MIERFKPVPYLVQRLLKNSEEAIKAGAQPFKFDYMGFAAFKCEALYKALLAFEYDGIFKLCSVSALDGENYVAYYVGKENGLNEAQAFFEAELKEKYTPRKELTYLYDSYTDPSELLVFRAYDGWWAIEPEYNFLLFKEEAHAKLWISYVEAKKLK